MWNLLLLHSIGDFILQTDMMAKNKKESSLFCIYHVIIYILPMAIFTNLGWVPLTLIAAQHYIQDRTHFIKWLMKTTGSADFSKDMWAMIVVDQIVHLTWITLVVKYFA